MQRYLSILLVVVSACGSEAIEDVGRSEEPLNGTLTTQDCSAEETAKLQAAMAHIVHELWSGRFHDCLGDALLTLDLDHTPEAIERKLRQNMPTHIRCVSGLCEHGGEMGNACADIGTPDERMDFERTSIASGSIEEIAGTIMHEIAHNKGFDHPHSTDTVFGFTVPEQVQQCIGTALEEPGIPSFSRSARRFDTELAAIGGGGGLPFELACGSCEHAMGMRVDASASFVNRIAVICETTTTGTAGNVNDSLPTRVRTCEPDEVLIGVISGSGAMVNGLVGICAERASVLAGDRSPSRFLDFGGSTAAEDETSRLCPPYMAVKRIYGRAGGRIDEMRFVCERLTAPPQGVPHTLARAGVAVGETLRAQCIDNGVMTGLWGSANSSTILSLGGNCLPTWSGITSDVALDDVNFNNAHLLESVGTRAATPFDDLCPEGALIGVQLRSVRDKAAGARIHQLRGICVDTLAWSNPAASVTRTFTPTHGGPTGTLQTLECPRGEFLTGMQAWASLIPMTSTRALVGLEPICRRIDYPLVGREPDLCTGNIDPRPPRGDVLAP